MICNSPDLDEALESHFRIGGFKPHLENTGSLERWVHSILMIGFSSRFVFWVACHIVQRSDWTVTGC